MPRGARSAGQWRCVDLRKPNPLSDCLHQMLARRVPRPRLPTRSLRLGDQQGYIPPQEHFTRVQVPPQAGHRPLQGYFARMPRKVKTSHLLLGRSAHHHQKRPARPLPMPVWRPRARPPTRRSSRIRLQLEEPSISRRSWWSSRYTSPTGQRYNRHPTTAPVSQQWRLRPRRRLDQPASLSQVEIRDIGTEWSSP